MNIQWVKTALCKFDNYAGKGVYFYFVPVRIQLAVPFKRQENRKKDGLLERKSFYSSTRYRKTKIPIISVYKEKTFITRLTNRANRNSTFCNYEKPVLSD